MAQKKFLYIDKQHSCIACNYYNRYKELEEENKHLIDELMKSFPIPQYKEGDVCINDKGEEVTIVAIVADQYMYNKSEYPYEKYEFFRPFEHLYRVKK